MPRGEAQDDVVTMDMGSAAVTSDDARAALPRVFRVIDGGVAEGLHLGAQVYVSIEGRPVVDTALGEAARGQAMTRDTLTLWFSSVKPVTAVAIAQQWELGRLDLDDPVMRHIPEFGVRGKEIITIRDVLTHTGGFRAEMYKPVEMTWDGIIARICDSRIEPGWVPGHKAGYHVQTGWYILAEIVQRLDGRPYAQYVREAVYQPLGMVDSWLGMTSEDYERYASRMAHVHALDHGKLMPSPYDSEERAVVTIPAGNGRGPIRELGRFYEAMLFKGQLNGVRILMPQTVEALTARHRVRMFDHTFKHVYDWGLGFVLDSKGYEDGVIPYAFGRHASMRAFGHGGYQCSMGFCDPEHGLVAAWVVNGLIGEERHALRNDAINTAIYEDLGFVATR